MHRKGLHMKNIIAISVPSYVLQTEVFAGSASVFYKVFNVPIF